MSIESLFEGKEIEEYPNQVTQSPVVSVCIVTYNHEDYIRSCLDGILMQETDFEFEVLVGEDNSSDATRAICVEYAKQYPDRIRLFLHKRENVIYINGLPTGRFNSLYNFYKAKGKYIALCDGDDYWTDSQKLQKQFHILEENPEVSYTFHGNIIVRDGEEVRRMNLNLGDLNLLNLEAFVKNNIRPHPATVMLRNQRKLPKGINGIFNFDTFMFFWLLNFGKAAFSSEVRPSVYRLHAGGMYTSLTEIMREKRALKTYALLEESLDKSCHRVQIYQVRVNRYRSFLIQLLFSRRLLSYFKYLGEYLSICLKRSDYKLIYIHIKDVLYRLKVKIKSI